MENSYVYFMTNKNNTVIYIGVTANLLKRVYEHKTKKHKGFTSKYNCDKLVYFEEFSNINDNIVFNFINPLENETTREQNINQLINRGLAPMQLSVSESGKSSKAIIKQLLLFYFVSLRT